MSSIILPSHYSSSAPAQSSSFLGLWQYYTQERHQYHHYHSRHPHHHHHSVKERRYVVRRQLLYGFVAIFFVSVQVGLLLWGYHVSQIPISSNDSGAAGPHEFLAQQQSSSQSRSASSAARPRRPDGYLNGFPIYYQDLTQDPTFYTRPYSQIHCVGENYQHQPLVNDQEEQHEEDLDNQNSGQQQRNKETAWRMKSCHYRFICLNLTNHQFQVYSRPELDGPLEQWSQRQKYRNIVDFSSSVLMTNIDNSNNMNGVSLSAINTEGDGLRWSPNVITDRPPPDKFYTLEEGVVLLPFFSLQGWDAKSLLWDDFLAMYNLLNIFQFDDIDQYQPLLMRYATAIGASYPNSCESSQAWYEECQVKLKKFISMMMNSNSKRDDNPTRTNTQSEKLLTTQKDAVLTFSDSKNKDHLQTDIVCAKDGVAGLGPLADHGANESPSSGQKHSHHYILAPGKAHNYGRGGLLWKFRRFCLHNLGLLSSETSIRHHDRSDAKSRQIIVSPSVVQLQAWLDPQRFLNFWHQDGSRSQQNVEIRQVDFSDIDLKESIRSIVDASVFITDCDDHNASVMAMFLSKGSTAMIYCQDSNDGEGNNDIEERRDFFNNLSYVHVHWMPKSTSQRNGGEDIVNDHDQSGDRQLFVEIVRHELQRQVGANLNIF